MGRTVLRAVAGAAVLAALLELTARLFLFGAAGLDPRRVDSVQALYGTGLLRPSELPELGFEFEAHASGWFKLASLRTNSRGLRDREYELEKPAGVFRVAVVGSSFALPAGVEIEDAFHSVLEERLTRESSGRRYEFINFAVGAYNALQTLAMLELRALAYDPDLVLFCITDLAAPGLTAPWNTPLHFRGIPPRTHPFFHSFFVKLAKLRLGIEDPSPPPLVTPDRVAARRLRSPSILERLGELGRTSGVPLVAVRLRFDPAGSPPAGLQLERRLREQGLFVVDTLPAFAGTRPSDFWIYELDPHPDRRAQAIFADVLASFLRANDLLGDRRRDGE